MVRTVQKYNMGERLCGGNELELDQSLGVGVKEESGSKANARHQVWVMGDVNAFNQRAESWSRLLLILFWNHFSDLHTLKDHWKHPSIS